MSLGPGKYDDACTLVRTITEGEAVLVIIVNGKRGSGFSMQTQSTDMLQLVPMMLVDVATQIREGVHHV